MKERYKRVKAVVLGKRHLSVFIASIETGATHWIPLSLIHGGSELKLRNAAYGEEFEIDIIEWKARELRL